MADTIKMMKGGQVRLVPKGKIKNFVERGFVEAVVKDGKLVAKGGAEDWEAKYKELKKEFDKLKKEAPKYAGK